MTDNTSAAAATSSNFENTCESYGIDSRLLYNDIEQLSNKRFRYTRQLVNGSRVLAVAAIAAAGLSGLGVYYQRAQIHRVWRLRHPHRVRQLALATTITGGFSLCTFLFLISPIGLMRLHDKELQRTRELDAIAVSALVQEQNFRTLAAWKAQSHPEKNNDKMKMKSTNASTTTTVAVQRAEERENALMGTAGQWVWKEVVLDPTPLLSGLQTARKATATSSDAEMQATLPAKASSEQSVTSPEKSGDAVRTGVDAAKKKMAANLLVEPSKASPAASPSAVEVSPSKTTATLSQSVDGLEDEDGDDCKVLTQRRVWTHTSDEAELQKILKATVEMWELLVKEKTDILAKVF